MDHRPVPVMNDLEKAKPVRLCPSPAELLKMPPDERDAILEAQAELAETWYRNDPSLTDFEAFGEDDLYGDATIPAEG